MSGSQLSAYDHEQIVAKAVRERWQAEGTLIRDGFAVAAKPAFYSLAAAALAISAVASSALLSSGAVASPEDASIGPASRVCVVTVLGDVGACGLPGTAAD